MGQASSPKKELGLELTNMKRNPYLVDYSQFQKKRRERDFAKRLQERNGRECFSTEGWQW